MVKLHDVSYTYMSGGPFEKTAVKGINLELKRGEFVGLIGHTGSGKSTLVQLIAGLTKPTAGTIEVDGKTLFKKGTDMRKLRFGIGLVMQYPDYQLFEETVFKDIAFGPSNMGLSSEEITRRVHFAADLVGIRREILEKSPFELSGGQKRRVAVAGVLAMEPKLLILDEPAAGLDPAGRDEILHKIRDMHRRLGITVVLVSHSMEDIAGLADRIVVMNKGMVAMTGKPVEVFKSAEELKKMGLSVPQITEVCNRLREAGVPIPDGLYTVESAKAELEKLLKNEMR